MMEETSSHPGFYCFSSKLFSDDFYGASDLILKIIRMALSLFSEQIQGEPSGSINFIALVEISLYHLDYLS